MATTDKLVNGAYGRDLTAARVMRVDVVADASGDATVDFPPAVGYIYSVRYIKDDFADGVDFTITNKNTGEDIWTELNVNTAGIRFPRFIPDGVDGAELTATTVAERHYLANESVRVVVAQAGNGTAGEYEMVVVPY